MGTGDEVAIAGTIIGNTSADPSLPRPDRRILMFGKGPSLAAFGLQGTLGNPQIQIAGTSLSNDNWKRIDDDSGDGPGGCNAAATDACNALQEKLDEAHLSPTNVLESALWPTFTPGGYTF